MLSAALCKHVRGHSLNIHNITIIPTLQFKVSLRIPAEQHSLPSSRLRVLKTAGLRRCHYLVIYCAVLRADGPFLRSGQVIVEERQEMMTGLPRDGGGLQTVPPLYPAPPLAQAAASLRPGHR